MYIKTWPTFYIVQQCRPFTNLFVFCWPTSDCSPPTEEEVDIAVSHLKNGKAPGPVCTLVICRLAELFKNAGPDGVKWLTSVFQSAWQSGIIPDEWRTGIILSFYKGKGSKDDCHNYRGITLLFVPGKAFARILLTRVTDVIVQSIRLAELITNDEVRSHTGQPFLSDTVRRRRLSFYGHLKRADPWQDH